MPTLLTELDAQYALDLVRRVCDQAGPGAPGTPQERERAGLLAAELSTHLGAENVTTEEFTLAPGAFLGALPVAGWLLLAGALLNLLAGRLPALPLALTSTLSLLLPVAGLLCLVLEYGQYREVLDRFFPPGRSVNVIGTLRRPGTDGVKRLLLVSGHHDSARENTWIGLLGYGFYATLPLLFLGLLAVAAFSAVQLAGALLGRTGWVAAGTLPLWLLTFPILPGAVVGLFFTRGHTGGGTVPGAADNLSACAVVATLARWLSAHPEEIPPETEIRFVTFGAEEAGLRGSRRYVQSHLAELKRLDARLLNLETIAYPQLSILTTDVNGVRHSPGLVESVIQAAMRADVPFMVRPQPTGAGGSDAGSFSQAGLKAVNLLCFQVPRQVVAFYHQPKDAPDVLTPEPLLNAARLALEWIRQRGE